MHRRVERGVSFSALAFLIFLSSGVYATQFDVAYVLEDNSQVSARLTGILNERGFSYDVVRDNEIATTDFSEYEMILAVEDVSHKNLIPFDEINGIFLDRRIAEEAWDRSNGGGFHTNKRTMRVQNINSFVLAGTTINPNGEINIYQPILGDEVQYLNPPYISGMSNVATSTVNNRPTLSYLERTINEKVVRHLFFGAPNSALWHDNSDIIFENALEWALADLDQDGDGFMSGQDCNDGDASIYPGAEEIAYDGIDQDCDGVDLLDVDGDGFCAEGEIIVSAILQCSQENGFIGTDCEDSDENINTANPDHALNCVNDAPEILAVVYEEIYSEGELVSILVDAEDAEGDVLSYSINDARFDVDGNILSWQTGPFDAGSYSFEITVSDGEFSAVALVEFEILDSELPPWFDETMPTEFEWEEDSVFSLNLYELFYDVDGNEFEVGIETAPLGGITVSVNSDGIASFVPDADFFGEREIVFFAENQNGISLSPTITLNVLPINDAPQLSAAIEDISWEEGEEFDNAIDLDDYFVDIDSGLQFSVAGNADIDVEVASDGRVSLSAPEQFHGSELVVFSASDGEFETQSNSVTLTILERNDAPVFNELNCPQALIEDTEYICELSATDAEGDLLVFSVADSDNLVCDIDGNVLTYRSEEDYFGGASCVLRVSDGNSADEAVFEVGIENVNDAPEIAAPNPTGSSVRVVENTMRLFSVRIEDSDSAPNVRWVVDGGVVLETYSETSSYEFLKPGGQHIIEVIVSDGEFEARRSWEVFVGPISEFSCAEVGGNICGGASVCGGAEVGTADSAICCLSACAPSFRDADACEVKNSSIELTIEKPEQNEEIEPGDTIRVRMKIENDFDDSQEFDVEAHLYNLNKDKSEAEALSSVKIDSGDDRILQVDVEVPRDLDVEGSYAIFVKAEDELCNQNYVAVNLQRPDFNVVFDKLDAPEKVMCGETLKVESIAENLGTKEVSAYIKISASGLGINQQSGEFVLEKFGNDNDKKKNQFLLSVPEDIEPGKYELKANIYYENKIVSENSQVEVECPTVEVSDSSESFSADTDEALILENNREPGSEIKSKESNSLKIKNKKIMLAAILMFNAVLFAAAGLLYAAGAKRRRYR